VRARHGGLFTLRFSLKGPVVFVAEPAEVRALLERDPGSARAGEARRVILPMASPRSVFGADDEAYRVAEERIATPFEPDAVARHRAGMAELAERHCREWPRRGPFRLLPRVRTLIDEIFVSLILRVRAEPRHGELVRAIGRMLWTPGNPPLPIPAEGDGLPGAIGKRVVERMQAPVARLIREEVAARRHSEEALQGHDLIATLLRAEPALPEAAIADELVAILAAAQEPPSIAVTWLLDRLARSAETRERYLGAGPGDGSRDAIVRYGFNRPPKPRCGRSRSRRQSVGTPSRRERSWRRRFHFSGATSAGSRIPTGFDPSAG
jgi:cytochrome P450 family 135